jgi:hypothetical protein
MEGAQPPNEAGTALMAALAAAGSEGKKKKRQPPLPQLGTPPQATGQPINGASLSTSRVGY